MNKIPQHIAIIPDGNRRWAKKRGLKPWEGHRVGAERLADLQTTFLKNNIKYLTFWAGSKDNLNKRSRLEIKFLIALLKKFLKKEGRGFITKGARFRMLGQYYPGV